MKYRDWNTNQHSVFHELDVLAPNSLISLLGVEQLELIFNIKYGNRTIIENVEMVNATGIALIIHKFYYEKWVKLAEIYLNDFEVGFSASTTSTTTTDESTLKELSSVTNDEVSAYNEIEMVDVASTGESINEVGSSDVTRTSTITHKSMKAVDLQRSLLENSNIVNVICEDVAKVITLPIYN